MSERETIYLSPKERAKLQKEQNQIMQERMERCRTLARNVLEKKQKVSEKDVLRAVLQYFRLKQCLCYRMNTGAGVFQNENGPRRFVKFGEKGMADLLVFTPHETIIWCECKSSVGRQSDHQKAFQKDVEAFGHIYILARSVDDVINAYEGRDY